MAGEPRKEDGRRAKKRRWLKSQEKKMAKAPRKKMAKEPGRQEVGCRANGAGWLKSQ